ncbi:hypothetical protein O181_039603 [Austropuccinia psidii MF-1]|uniref:Uncharacterized protein n=1 Tax=Austropuccinia psidii MF-1 TaxID=1389203 RepID=A0A9Q3DFL6_9BASI|nr:hypothetical protein [Austropuccinia psidii MF-1]
MEYMRGTSTKMTVCIDNAQHPYKTDIGAHSSIVAREYLQKHFPNWEKQLFPKKAKNLKSASRNITSIGTITKEIIIHHRKGNIRLNPEFVVLEDAHIQDPLEELINELKGGKSSAKLTSKQKLSLPKTFRENIPDFAIGEEPLGKMRGHNIELYLDVERPYPPVLREPPYPESLETRREIDKNVNELLDMDFIIKIGHKDIVEVTTAFVITWHDGKYRLCGDFRSLKNYNKADR